ncbi:MAG: hypothetical protein GEU83_13150 [Pseudonocardiaceae bacterium]|nr:hypothetical protein [Pseudonocardiaceae bacterium]
MTHSDAREADTAGTAVAVETFWSWWYDRFREYLTNAIVENRVEQVIDPLSARLRKVHPNLIFDLRPGTNGRIALVIGSDGKCPDALVDQVLASAPEADEKWEYGPADDPIPDPRELSLKAGDRNIDLARMRVAMHVDDARLELELEVYHPELADIPELERESVVTTALNVVAGHAPPLRHRARRSVTCTPPEDGLDLAELRERMAALDRWQTTS